MKNIFKYSFIILSMFTALFSKLENVFAKVDLGISASGWYFERDDKNGNSDFSGTLENYSINGEVSYCIELGAPEGESMSQSTWEKTSHLCRSSKDYI